MKLFLEKTIRRPAFEIAVSPDGTRAASSGERKIYIWALPDMELVETICTAHTSSMVFLSDNRSMLILNTTGNLFRWDGAVLRGLGRWPAPKWSETPLFYAGDDCVLWAGHGGIWKYHAWTGEMRNLFPTSRMPMICGCENNVVRFITEELGNDEQNLELVTMTGGGDICSRCWTKDKLYTRLLWAAAWSDKGTVAISAASRPTAEPCRLWDMDTSEFSFLTPELMDDLNALDFLALNASRTPDMMYLLDGSTGEMIVQKADLHEQEGGSVYCGEGMLAKSSRTGAGTVSFFNDGDLSFLCRLEKADLDPNGTCNPPTKVTFLPDRRVLVGSWECLFLYRSDAGL